MKNQMVFQRREIKYLITKEQKAWLLSQMAAYITDDTYGRNTICNLYYDTPSYLLIRRSLEGTAFKEKLRLRSYGAAKSGSETFIELKRKCQSLVYKRRMGLPEAEAMAYLAGKRTGTNTQISQEIDYFLGHYQSLHPTVFLSYDREAFYGIDTPDFRITFDENILWRNQALSLCDGIYGAPILASNQVLMELKIPDAIPLWFSALLAEKRIYKTSFSKYGMAYQAMQTKLYTGGKQYA